MKKIILENGITLVCKDKNGRQFGLSVTFKCGHINEPKLGLAALYENIVSKNSQGIASIYGGSLTSFFTTATSENFAETVKNLHDRLIFPPLTEQNLQIAADDIIRHTQDLSPLPLRQTKLAYKHTAFSRSRVVWDAEQYIQSVKSLTLDDVRQYIDSGYTGSNIVIGFTGARTEFSRMAELVKEYFGHLPKGKRQKLNNLLYTGGFQKIESGSDTQIAMFGWDISNMRRSAEINVLISILSSRLERRLSAIPAISEVKIAGYFGFRTLRVCVICENPKKFDECLEIVCSNLKRLHKTLASDRRMETSRQKAMTLAIATDPQPASVEIAWQLLGRNTDYDVDECIDSIYRVSPRDVQDTANIVFSKQLTCVLYTNCCNETYRNFEARIL